MTEFKHKTAKFTITRNLDGSINVVNPRWKTTNLYNATPIGAAQYIAVILSETFRSMGSEDCTCININASWN